jgi:hypothetical protein
LYCKHRIDGTDLYRDDAARSYVVTGARALRYDRARTVRSRYLSSGPLETFRIERAYRLLLRLSDDVRHVDRRGFGARAAHGKKQSHDARREGSAP